MISSPISNALLPKMAILCAEGNEKEFLQLYRKTTQLTCAIAFPSALVLAFFAKQVLLAWSGNEELAQAIAPALRLYALGNVLTAIGGVSHCLQFVKGDLKLHLIGTGLFAAVLLPAIFSATWRFGFIGPGYAWLGANVLYFCCWVPLSHRRFFKDLHSKWLVQDILPIITFTSIGAMIAYAFIPWPIGRIQTAIRLTMISATLLSIAFAGSTWGRILLLRTFRSKFQWILGSKPEA